MERLKLAATALALSIAASSCISVAWQRERVDEARRPEALDSLKPGDDLERCLAVLGAPIDVWETTGDGAALAFGWLDADSKGLNVSVPIVRGASASVDYTDKYRSLPGAVLFFDASWKLVSLRVGHLRDLLPVRRPPRSVENDG